MDTDRVSIAGANIKVLTGNIQLGASGSETGQIEINSTRLLLRSTGDASGLRFDGSAYTPFKNGSQADGTVDLGSSSGKYKDLYLGGSLITNGAPFTLSNTSNGNNIDIKTTSGGSLVHAVKIHSGGRLEAKQGLLVGGDATANLLDDYEEGTWTAQITDGSTDVDLTTSAVYTKIGNLVTVSFDKYNVNISSLSSTSDLSIKTLPFPSNATSHGNKIIHITGTSSGSNVPVLLYPVNTATGVALYKAVSSSQNMAALKPSDLASQVSVRLTFTYFTDS